MYKLPISILILVLCHVDISHCKQIDGNATKVNGSDSTSRVVRQDATGSNNNNNNQGGGGSDNDESGGGGGNQKSNNQDNGNGGGGDNANKNNNDNDQGGSNDNDQGSNNNKNNGNNNNGNQGNSNNNDDDNGGGGQQQQNKNQDNQNGDGGQEQQSKNQDGQKSDDDSGSNTNKNNDNTDSQNDSNGSDNSNNGNGKGNNNNGQKGGSKQRNRFGSDSNDGTTADDIEGPWETARSWQRQWDNFEQSVHKTEGQLDKDIRTMQITMNRLHRNLYSLENTIDKRLEQMSPNVLMTNTRVIIKPDRIGQHGQAHLHLCHDQKYHMFTMKLKMWAGSSVISENSLACNKKSPIQRICSKFCAPEACRKYKKNAKLCFSCRRPVINELVVSHWNCR